MRFKINPFWLHPIKEDKIPMLFVDREDELTLVRSILKTEFQDPSEICAVVGGIGIGKSSLLYQAKRIAEDSDLHVEYMNGTENIISKSEELIKNKDVAIIDDVDKLDDDHAKIFYDKLETLLDDINFVFFSDSFKRNEEIRKIRSFITTDSLGLPKMLSNEELFFFLKKRMEKCLIKDVKGFELPFEDTALDMAAIRSNGNLRNFFDYTQSGWKISRGTNNDIVNSKHMQKGIILKDRTILGGRDIIDYKIIWNSTKGEFNKKLLAHECGINRGTLDNRIKNISHIINQENRGKEVIISSIYNQIPEGTKILKGILKDLRVNIDKL